MPMCLLYSVCRDSMYFLKSCMFLESQSKSYGKWVGNNRHTCQGLRHQATLAHCQANCWTAAWHRCKAPLLAAHVPGSWLGCSLSRSKSYSSPSPSAAIHTPSFCFPRTETSAHNARNEQDTQKVVAWKASITTIHSREVSSGRMRGNFTLLPNGFSAVGVSHTAD